MTIKGSLLLSVSIVKPFSVENILSHQNGSQKWWFFAKWGSKYYFLFSKPPKGTSLRGTASFDVFCVKISFGVWAVACSLAEEPKKTNIYVLFHAYGEKNPWSNLHKILHWGRYPERNHRCKFGGRSVEPFLRGEGSNFRLFNRLSQSSLQHSRTTVRVCDIVDPNATVGLLCSCTPRLELILLSWDRV